MAIETPPGKLVVLVVEDEPILRMMAVDLVEDAGFEVVEAADADEAMQLLESRWDIRIVFSDIHMPGSMDGMRLAALIRDRWPRLEIILTSGKLAPRPENMPSRGVFFSKPYQPSRVVAELRRMAA